MTWLAQVRHIAWKDVRQSRWLLGLYVAIALVATVRTLTTPGSWNNLPFPLMFLVIVTGIATAATIVQSDSPTRSDALWASRPFHASAMLGAKMLLIVIVVLALPVVGEVVALRVFDLPRNDAAFLAWQSTMTYAMWLLAAVVVAALTRDLRTFVVTLLGILMALFLVASIPMGVRTWLRPPMLGETLALAAVALGTILLWRLYRTHDGGVEVWTIAVLVIAIALTAIVIGPPVRVFPDLAVSPRPFPRVQILDRNRIAERRYLPLSIDSDNLPDTLAVEFATDSAILHMRVGSPVRVVYETGPYTLAMPPLPARSAVRLLGRDVALPPATRLGIPLPSKDTRAIERDLASVELVGSISLLRPGLVGELPLRAGASMTHGGTRARIARFDVSTDDVVVELETASASRQRVPDGRFRSIDGFLKEPRYVLANFARGEAVALYSGNSSGGQDWLVLPGAALQINTTRLSAKSGGGNIVPDNAWLRGASLLIIDWVPISSYPVRTNATVP